MYLVTMAMLILGMLCMMAPRAHPAERTYTTTTLQEAQLTDIAAKRSSTAAAVFTEACGTGIAARYQVVAAERASTIVEEVLQRSPTDQDATLTEVQEKPKVAAP